LGELVAELSKLLLVLAGIEVTKGAVSLAVQALSGEAALLGVAGDRAASSEENTGGAGESLKRRYVIHG
jgi:hypothetical protein